MKKIGIILLLTAMVFQGFSQEIPEKEMNKEALLAPSDTNENAKVVIGKDLFIAREDKDGVSIRVKNRGLSILESLEGGTKVNFDRYEGKKDGDQDESKDRHERNARRFKGHWAGAEIGYNTYLTSNHSQVMPANIDYMTLHSSKSSNFNLNFSQLSLGLTRHVGFVTGLGINFNNYRFDGNNNIFKGTGGVIEALDPGVQLKKSKFSTIYLDLPFLLEVQLPAHNNHINIAAGPLGAIKIASHTKMVYQDGDKVKSDSDLSLNLLRYGATARVGYENFQIYGTYYMTPLFNTGKGPEGNDLYPFEIGFAFTFND